MAVKCNVEIRRTINAPSQRVYDAFTKKGELEKWYGPENMTSLARVFDAREGGAFKITMKSAEGEEYTVEGVFKELHAPNKIVHTWRWLTPPPPGEESLVTIALKEKGGNTELVFTHSNFGTEEQAQHHKEGWESSFNKLEKLF